MTQEQKAKAYDEALERAKKQRADYQKELDKTDKNSQLAGLLRAGISAIDMAFPELAGSEDERIRKDIIEHFQYEIEELSNKGEEYEAEIEELSKYVSYLEKQKEPRDYRKLYKGVSQSEWFKKSYVGKSLGEEQKPEECNECAMFLSGECTHPNGKCKNVKPKQEWNEDERIRKEIILLINACAKDGHFVTLEKHDSEEMLAWLEKQKEASKAIEAVERIDKYIDEHLANAHDMKDSNPDKKYYRGWDDALAKMSGILQDAYSGEKQKEQKFVSCDSVGAAILSALASGIDPDEILKARGFTFEDVEKYLASIKQKEQEPIDPCDASWDAYYRRGYQRGLEVGRKEQKTTEKHDLVAQLKEHLANTPKEQLEAEWKELEKWNHVGPTVEEYPEGWSNEDEKMLELVYGKRLSNNVAAAKPEWSEEDEKQIRQIERIVKDAGCTQKLQEQIHNWFKSLRPKQEWSKEDEEMVNAIIDAIPEDIAASDYKEMVDWLKSLRPSWKPSEDEERLINTSISFLKDFADKGYENAVECIDWLKSKSNGNSDK